jgi:hypothetical protein
MALLIPGAGLVDATDTLLIPGAGIVEQAATGLALSIDTAGALTITGQDLTTDLSDDLALSIDAGVIAIGGQSQTVSLTLVAANGAITLAGQQVAVAGLGVNVFPWVRLAHVDPRDRSDSVDERDRLESVPPRRPSSPLTA